MTDTWHTAITRIAPNSVRVRGYDIAELMGRVSFGSAVYLLLRGEVPAEPVGRLMDAILVSSIDHGVTPPSALAARTVASTGGSLAQAVAAGVLTINRFHGGAIEDCARQLQRILQRAEAAPDPHAPDPAAPLSNDALDAAAAAELADMKARGQRMSGFGHRYHTADPRTARLFELSARAGLVDHRARHIAAAHAVERAFASAGRPLPINVDGAIGAILADLGFEPETMNGLFMIARVPGLVAHAVEECARERPMRRIDPNQAEYDGPPPRDLGP